MVKFNELGGIEAQHEDELKRAKKVDLITMPRDIDGTNCFNCKFIRDKKERVGYCSHKDVSQDVNKRMCCVRWSRTGEYRQFHGRNKEYD
jgi:hypothetical protein